MFLLQYDRGFEYLADASLTEEASVRSTRFARGVKLQRRSPRPPPLLPRQLRRSYGHETLF